MFSILPVLSDEVFNVRKRSKNLEIQCPPIRHGFISGPFQSEHYWGGARSYAKSCEILCVGGAGQLNSSSCDAGFVSKFGNQRLRFQQTHPHHIHSIVKCQVSPVESQSERVCQIALSLCHGHSYYT